MKYHKPQLTEELHTYSFEGVEYPGVTQILADMYNFDGIPNAVLERARERGSAVHKACELEDLGDLDFESIDYRVMPYVLAWQQFKEDTGFEVGYDSDVGLLTEQQVMDQNDGYCGTPDVIGFCLKLKGEPKVVIDRKATAQMSRVTGLQLSGYKRLMKANGHDCSLRYGVQLFPDGTYKLFPFLDPMDDLVFQSMLIAYKWRKKNVR